MVASYGARPLGFSLFLEPSPVDLFATAASLRLTHLLHRRITHHLHLTFCLYSYEKINGLIDQGQSWRPVTSSFLHANIRHLMVNCYSLNSIGPAVEKISGTWRFLAVYFASEIASSSVSYWFCKAPSVGAFGAIFGLVGSFALFVARHIAHIIILNMAIGIMSRDIDNWGHVGGFLGGAAISWLLGPAWKIESEEHFQIGLQFFTLSIGEEQPSMVFIFPTLARM